MPVFRSIRRWTRALGKRPMILAYHRVNECCPDPQLLSVSPRRFEEQLDLLAGSYQCLPLSVLLERFRQSPRSTRRCVALTFDDGYADNLSHALPLLEKFDIPACLFACTGLLGQKEEPYWDALVRLLLLPGLLRNPLEVSSSRGGYRASLGGSAAYGPEAFFAHQAWNVLSKGTGTERQACYLQLCELLKPLPDSERRAVLAQIEGHWAGPVPQPLQRFLSWEELGVLARSGLVEIGGHTHSHPCLAALPPASQSSELRESKRLLEEALGRPIHGLAYPYGQPHDFDGVSRAEARGAGYAFACSTLDRSLAKGLDHFAVPRFTVRNWSGEEFSRQLSEWAGR